MQKSKLSLLVVLALIATASGGCSKQRPAEAAPPAPAAPRAEAAVDARTPELLTLIDLSRPAGHSGGFEIYQGGKLVLEGPLPGTATYARVWSTRDEQSRFLSAVLDGQSDELDYAHALGRSVAEQMAADRKKFYGEELKAEDIARDNVALALKAQAVIRDGEPFAILVVAYSAEGAHVETKTEGQVLGPGYLRADGAGHSHRARKSETPSNEYAIHGYYREIFVGEQATPEPGLQESRAVAMTCVLRTADPVAESTGFDDPHYPTQAHCQQAFGDLLKVDSITPQEVLERDTAQSYIDRRGNRVVTGS